MIDSSVAKWRQSGQSAIDRIWARHDKTILRLAVMVMSFAALIWLGYEF